MKKHSWVFTLNNYSLEELPIHPAPRPGLSCGVDPDIGLEKRVIRKGPAVWQHADLVYIGYGKEIAGTSTPHLQGMLVFKQPVGLRTLKRLNGRAHFQPMLGTFEEAKRYCSKENFTEWVWHGIDDIEQIRLKVEEDHYRAKVIQDEENTIVSISEKLDKLTKLIELLDDSFEKKIQNSLDEKLNGLLYKDKFV